MAFEVGTPDLRAEKSNGAELSLHGTRGAVHVSGSLYYNRYSNFIFQAPTGETEDDLPVYKFLQGKADYYGFELQSDAKFGHAFGILWGGELQADAVRATVTDFGDRSGKSAVQFLSRCEAQPLSFRCGSTSQVQKSGRRR